MMFAPLFMDHWELWQHVQQCGHKEDISNIYFFYFIRHINSSSHSRQVFWRALKSLVGPTWGSNYVELQKVGTWGPLPTSSTRKG
jgi:hypothetical protein